MQKFQRIIPIVLAVLTVAAMACGTAPAPAETAEPEVTPAPSPALSEIWDTPVPAVDELLYGKPVIYLYPETPTEINVQLQYNGTLDCTYPAYDNGWIVTAHPDGTLIDLHDGKEYSYLFWEGHGEANYDFTRGFVVKGKDTAAFLREKLAHMGLLPHEYNEFIVYWLPKMQNNAYNLITFQGEAYTSTAELIITPAPDSILRVFMAYKPLDAPIAIEEQPLTPFTRSGFTVIEWGGCEISNK
ncbi:MAG: hypothetical protein FWF10_10680 [Clostridiales bacterium]|nr:hypothetical protein [Clostridiales bacterium]